MCLNIRVLQAEDHIYKYVGVKKNDDVSDVLLNKIH